MCIKEQRWDDFLAQQQIDELIPLYYEAIEQFISSSDGDSGE